MSTNRELFLAHIDHSKKLKKIVDLLSSAFETIRTANPDALSHEHLIHVVSIMKELNAVNNFVVEEYVDVLELAECMVVEGRV